MEDVFKNSELKENQTSAGSPYATELPGRPFSETPPYTAALLRPHR